MNKHLRIILAISLAINLLLIGAIGGRMLHGFKHGHPKLMSPDNMKKELSSFLPANTVEKLEASMHKNFEKRKDTFSAIKAAHQEMETIMTAETFDAEAFKLQIDILDSLQAKTFKGIGESLLEILPTLTHKERILLAKHLKKNKPRPGMTMPPPKTITCPQDPNTYSDDK